MATWRRARGDPASVRLTPTAVHLTPALPLGHVVLPSVELVVRVRYQEMLLDLARTPTIVRLGYPRRSAGRAAFQVAHSCRRRAGQQSGCARSEPAMPTIRNGYRAGVVAALAGSLFIVWLIGAVGILGVEGDRADLAYLGVLLVALVGSLVLRLRPAGLVWIMLLSVGLIGVIGVVSLLLGMHRAAHSSVLEIGGLTVLLAGPYAAAAWCFHVADQRRSAPSGGLAPRN